MKQDTINVRGVEHYYQWIPESENIENKPVMVFIHGWGGSARYWESTAYALSDQFFCLLYDMRGFGRSRLPSNEVNLSYEIEEYAEDLAAFLDALGLEQVYINSHSMGASVATLFVNRYPERVKKLIITCNGVFTYDEKAFKAFHKFGGYVVKFRYKWYLKIPFMENIFMARFLHKSIKNSEQKAFLEDFLMADYEAALGTIYTSVSKKAADIMPKEFAQISVPTLLIAGEKDIITPAAMGRQAAELSEKIQYVEISKTAHFPMLEDPDNYLEIVREFVGQKKERG